VQGKKKKSFHAYRLLHEKAVGFDSVRIVRLGNVTDDNETGGNGVWVVEFSFGNEKKWVMWSPDGQTHALSGLSNGRLAVTRVVPTELFNDGDSAVFASDTFDVSGASHTLALTSIPLWVEELPKDSVSSVAAELSPAIIRVYPNPSRKTTRIESPGVRSLRIFDAWGKLVWEKRDSLPTEFIDLDVENWLGGIYLAEINGRVRKAFAVAPANVTLRP
jgi:hypothetical protein